MRLKSILINQYGWVARTNNFVRELPTRTVSGEFSKPIEGEGRSAYFEIYFGVDLIQTIYLNPNLTDEELARQIDFKSRLNFFGVDVETKHVTGLMKRLGSLKTTGYLRNEGVYREDIHYSKLIVQTTKTLEEFSNWCDKFKGTVGTFDRRVSSSSEVADAP